jgi:hypothetical protein
MIKLSLTTGEMSAADLAAVVGNRNDGGFGDMGSGWWIILLFLCLFGNGGWGNGFGGGNSNGGAGGLYPWMNQADITNSGFRDQMINDNITSIRDGIYGLSNQLCSCCGDMRDTVNQGFYSAEVAAANRQMANMNSIFGVQNAINAGFNATQAQLAQCCCDNRLATCQTQNIIQSESAATRFADANNTRDIIQSQSNGTQAILDKLCQLELDAKNDTISQLRQELLYAKGQASQDVQTAILRQGQEAEVDALYNRLNNCPVGTVPVYGRQPIFNCSQNAGCGCGCG